VIGAYISTRIQQAAQRHKKATFSVPYTLLMDEFQAFSDPQIGNLVAQMQGWGLRFVCAHQNISQEPFSKEGWEGVLETIQANSEVRVSFAVDRKTAAALAPEMFQPTQRKLNFVYRKPNYSETKSHSTARGEEQSEMHSRGTSDERRTSRTRGETHNPHDYSADRQVQSSVTDGEGRRQDESSGTKSSRSNVETDTEAVQQGYQEEMVYYPLDGERELHINHLQGLRKRHCLISGEAMHSVEVRTLDVMPANEVFLRTNKDDTRKTILERQVKLHQLPAAAGPEEGEAAKRSTEIGKEEKDESGDGGDVADQMRLLGFGD
jgi:hypothetical protein